jgi:ATP-dependent RNA helicase DDX3X
MKFSLDFFLFNSIGSGKTGGFLFPTIAKMLHSGAAPIPEHIAPRGRGMAFPNCLILAPTRELAIQVYFITY